MSWLRQIFDAWYNFRRGVGNLWRWAPVIWGDEDFDWAFIARVLEFKLRKHAEHERVSGHHVDSQKSAHQMLVCAELLRRLDDDGYWENAQKRFGCSSLSAKFCCQQMRSDQRYLGLLIGKYLTSWWD